MGKKHSIDQAALAQLLIKVTVAIILLGGGTFAFVSMRQQVLDDLGHPAAVYGLATRRRSRSRPSIPEASLREVA